MRIAMMGSGGIGGYFGARLADAGADVTFIARGRHLAAMNETGLRIPRFAWWPLVSAIGWGLLFPGALPGLYLALTTRRAP